MNFVQAVIFLSFAAPAASQVAGNCGASGFSAAGSSTVFPVLEQEINVYKGACSQTITIEGGGSSVGAGRVCGNPARGTPVEIGNMSREWDANEASTVDGWNYKCKLGDTSRSVIQVPIALDGLTVATRQSNSVASTCVSLMGGMTQDQLRWVYSSYNVAKLTATGWKQAALSAGDTTINVNDRQWCRLDKRCACSEINLAGADDLSGTHVYFKETILTDFKNGETFEGGRLKGYFNSALDENIAAYVENDGAAVGYFGYAYYAADINRLNAVPIQNRAGDFITPSPETVANGDYNPLSRKIYCNLLTTALARTRPLLEFTYTTQGTSIVKSTGYVPMPEADQVRSLSRMKSIRGIDLKKIVCGEGKAFTVGGSTTLLPAMNVWSYHYVDKCYQASPTIRSAGLAAAYRRVCGFTTSTTGANVGAVIQAAMSTDAPIPALYATAAGAGKFTCKGTSPVVGLTQLEMIPKGFVYANNAAAVLGITRNFLRFALSADGARLVTAIGGTPIAAAKRTTMLARIPAPATGGGFCFAGESTVEVMNKGSVAMKDLALGDIVKVAGGKFSEVYSFGHYQQGVKAQYLAVATGLEKPLYITPDHMVFVQNKAVPASMLSVGDKIDLVNGEVTIQKITNVVRSGAFAPFTKEGTIVVDGVVASSFVSLQPNSASLKVGSVDTFNMHFLAHLFQAPHRLYCELVGCKSENYNASGHSLWIAAPLTASKWLLEQNAFIMTVVFMPIMALVLVVSSAEAMLLNGPMMLLIAALMLVVGGMRKSKKALA